MFVCFYLSILKNPQLLRPAHKLLRNAVRSLSKWRPNASNSLVSALNMCLSSSTRSTRSSAETPALRFTLDSLLQWLVHSFLFLYETLFLRTSFRPFSALRTHMSLTWTASTITVWLLGNDSWPWTTCQEERRPSLLSLWSLPFTGEKQHKHINKLLVK